MGDDILEKGEVGRYAAHPELAQGAIHAGARLVRGIAPHRHLHQQGVVERGDDRAGVGGAAIEPHAQARRTAVSGNAPVVGGKAVLGVFGGDPALQRMAVKADCLLVRDHAVFVADARAFGDADLRLDDIHTGDLLGHRVFDLDTRIDLDEVEVAGIHVHQELDRPGVRVAHFTCELERRFTQLCPAPRIEVGRGCALDHLLVASLHRTVALEQMHQLAVGIAKHLHFDVTRTPHQLFEIDLVIAESRRSLATRGIDRIAEFSLGLDGAHAATTATPARLEHQRIAYLCRQATRGIQVIRQRTGRWHHRHTGTLRQFARRHLVAELTHHRRARPDEGNPGRRTGLGEIGVLGQEAVARMDCVHLGLARNADDVGDVEVGLDRLLARPHLVGLVGLETMEGKAVFMRIDADRADVHLARGTEHPNGDFTAVRDQNAADLLHVWLLHVVRPPAPSRA